MGLLPTDSESDSDEPLSIPPAPGSSTEAQDLALKQLKAHSDSTATYRSQHYQRDPTNTLTIARLQQALIAVSSTHPGSADIIWAHRPTGKADGWRNITLSVAETLKKNGTLLAGFFFNTNWYSGDPDRCFVPTLASQVGDTIPHAQLHVLSSIQGTLASNIFLEPVRHQTEALLERPLLSAIRADAPEWSPGNALFIVVDGLDEVEDRRNVQAEIIGALDHLATAIRTNTNRRLKILIASEATPHLKRQFKSLGDRVAAVDMDPDGSLESFYETRLRIIRQRHALDKQWPPQERVEWFKERSLGEPWRDFAETAMRFLDEGQPNSRLEMLQSKIAASGSEHLLALDGLYTMILHGLAPELRQSVPLVIQPMNHPNWVWRGESHRVMEYILDLPSGCMYRLSTSSHLAALVDLGNSNLFKPYHTSFADFLTNPERSGQHALFVEPATVRRVLIRAQALKCLLEPTISFVEGSAGHDALSEALLKEDVLHGFYAHDMAEAFRDRFWSSISSQPRSELQWQAIRCLARDWHAPKPFVQRSPIEQSRRARAVQNFVQRLNVATLDIWAITFLRRYHTTYIPLGSPVFESEFLRRHQPLRSEFRRRTQAYALGSFEEEFALCFLYLSALQCDIRSTQSKPLMKGAGAERIFIQHTIRKDARLQELDRTAWNLQDVDSWAQVAAIWPSFSNTLWFDANIETLAAPGKAELITTALSAVVGDPWIVDMVGAVKYLRTDNFGSLSRSNISSDPDASRVVLSELRLKLLTKFLSQYAATLPVQVLIDQCHFALTNVGLKGEWDFLSLLIQHFNPYNLRYLGDEDIAIYTRAKSRYDDLVTCNTYEELEELYYGLALLLDPNAATSTRLDLPIPVVPYDSESEGTPTTAELGHDDDLALPPASVPLTEAFLTPTDVDTDSDIYTDSAPSPPPSVDRPESPQPPLRLPYDGMLHDLERQYVKNNGGWAAPLTSAPSAMSVMVLLSKVANSKAASSLQLDDLSVVVNGQTGGTLPSKYLHSNLQHCVDLGRLAFFDIHNRMNLIHTISQRMIGEGGPIVRIIEYLRDPEDPDYELAAKVDSVMVSGAECFEIAKDASKRFKYWHHIIKHLETCSLLEHGVLVRERLDAKGKTEVNETRWREKRRGYEEAIVGIRREINNPDSNPSGSYLSEGLDDLYNALSLSSNRLEEVKAKLEALETQMRQLQAKVVDLEGIESVLQTSSDQVAELEAQFESLIGFFSAISAGLKADLSGNVDAFMQQKGSLVERVAIESGDFAQSVTWRMTKAALEARGHFSAMASISEAYEDVALSYIRPSLKQLEALASGSNTRWRVDSEQFIADCYQWGNKIEEIVVRATEDLRVKMKDNTDLL